MVIRNLGDRGVKAEVKMMDGDSLVGDLLGQPVVEGGGKRRRVLLDYRVYR